MNISKDKVESILKSFSELAIALDNAAKALQAIVQSDVRCGADGPPELPADVVEKKVTKRDVHDAEETETLIKDNYHELMKDELKDLCRSRNLGVSGSKWDLVTRLVAYDTAKPNIPSEALTSFDLQFFERKSNSDQSWNPKCHSGQSMELFLHICQNRKGNKYIVVFCQCKKQCLNGIARALVPSSDREDPSVVLFQAEDTNQLWKNYLCTFKATFTSSQEADRFRATFNEVQVCDMNHHDENSNDDFQSQKWY